MSLIKTSIRTASHSAPMRGRRPNIVRCIVITVLGLLSYGCSQDDPSRSVSFDGKTYNYRVYVPENLDRGGTVPVMLYLHGAGSRGSNNVSNMEEIPSLAKELRDQFQYIIVFPQCPDGLFWDEENLGQAVAAVDQAVSEFNGDASRLYLGGYSMGGHGIWQGAVTFQTSSPL
ncbi:MAG: hypothetical protein ABR530_03000 [Pyrinomonadaceae bacterium]